MKKPWNGTPEEVDPFAEFGGVSVETLERRRREREEGSVSAFGGARTMDPSCEGPDGNRRGPMLVTDMKRGTTTFYKDDGTPPLSIETRNEVHGDVMPGANDPYNTPDVVGVQHRGDTAPYGKDGAYIKTGDNKGRDIHGGGRTVPDPLAGRQPLTPTAGCTRGHNDDIIRLGEEIEEYRRRHPGVAIPYERR